MPAGHDWQLVLPAYENSVDEHAIGAEVVLGHL